MQHMYDGWDSRGDWLWMALTMLVWLVALGGVVYAAVRLALDREHRSRTPR